MGNLHHLGILLHWEFTLVYSWNHPGQASPYLEQTGPWATDLNFKTSVWWRSGCRAGMWWQSCHCCAPFLRFSQKLLLQEDHRGLCDFMWGEPPTWYEPQEATGDTPLASRNYLRKSIRENLSAQLNFLSLCQAFCDLPECTSMRELTELPRLSFTITRFLILLHFLCATGLCWGNRGSYVDDDLGDDTTLQWPGHGTTSCRVT